MVSSLLIEDIEESRFLFALEKKLRGAVRILLGSLDVGDVPHASEQ
jgi:hypothetical protein